MSRTFTELLTTVLLIFLVFCASKAVVRALPGDPIQTLIAESGTKIPAAELRSELGLDKPFFGALFEHTRNAANGDFGKSIISRKPVGKIVQHRFVRTLQLAAASIALAIGLSLLLGISAAVQPGGKADRLCEWLNVVTISMPVTWFGPLLILIFAVWIPVVPTGESIFLPALTLGVSLSGFWSRLVRARVQESLKRGWADSARARGIPELKVVLKYGLWPASGSLIGFIGTQIGALFGGAFVTEAVFDWKGLGSLLIESVLKRDYPVFEASIFIGAATIIIGTRFGDMVQSFFVSKGGNE